MDEPDSRSLEEPEPVGPDQGLPAATAEKTKRRISKKRWAIEVVVIVAAAFVLALLVQQFLVKPYEIPSVSMEPTLAVGDRVLVSRLTYHFRSPERGDVIVFHPPGEEDAVPLIKRVVAVAGDTVSVRDGKLWLNGIAQDEPYLKEYPIEDDYPETTVDPGYVWAMGDNRNDSGDSRVFGQVDEDEIIGVAFAIYWPPGDIGGL
jgi:signal peptidase I